MFAADTTSSQRVYLVVALLVAVGIALAVVAVWLVRATKVEPELLAPLERMSDKSWVNTDPAEQHRLLDDVRPEGAEPIERSRQAPDVDPDLDPAGPPAQSLDDLPSVNAVKPRVRVVTTLPPPSGPPARGVPSSGRDPLLPDPSVQEHTPGHGEQQPRDVASGAGASLR